MSPEIEKSVSEAVEGALDGLEQDLKAKAEKEADSKAIRESGYSLIAAAASWTALSAAYGWMIGAFEHFRTTEQLRKAEILAGFKNKQLELESQVVWSESNMKLRDTQIAAHQAELEYWQRRTEKELG